MITFNIYHWGGWKIAVSNADGSNARRLTKAPHYEYNAVWAPDGKRLAYTKYYTAKQPRFRNGNQEIYIVDLETAEEKK